MIMNKEFFLSNDINNEIDLNQPSLISRLMKLKEKCNKEITVGNFLFKKKDKKLKIHK